MTKPKKNGIFNNKEVYCYDMGDSLEIYNRNPNVYYNDSYPLPFLIIESDLTGRLFYETRKYKLKACKFELIEDAHFEKLNENDFRNPLFSKGLKVDKFTENINLKTL